MCFIALTVSPVLCVCAVSGPSISVSQMQAAVLQAAMLQVRKRVQEMDGLQLKMLQLHLLGSSQRGFPLSLVPLLTSQWVELVGVAHLLLLLLLRMIIVGVWLVAKGQPLSMKD